jgi:hypothetical protein
MNHITKQNQWLDSLIAALKAKEDHKAALAKLIAHHGGKRTMPLMEDLCAGIHAAYPKSKAEVKVYMGQPNVSFPDKGAGYDTWRDLIAPHLPKIKAATTKPRSSKATDPVASYAKRIMRDLTAAQRRRLVALVG